MRRLCTIIGCCVLTVAMLVFVLFNAPAQAEWYVAGQGGATYSGFFDPLGISTGPAAGTRFSQLGLQSSPLYGGKIGYYLDGEGWQWLGFEMEAYSSTQHVKQQGVEIIGPGGTSDSVQLTTGKDVRVTTWAPISMMVRIPIGALEPYVGVGFGVSFLHIHDAATDTTANSNMNTGLIGKAGLRWRMTKHLALFGEWKYHEFDFGFDKVPIGSVSGDGQGTFRTHIAVGGIGWHF